MNTTRRGALPAHNPDDTAELAGKLATEALDETGDPIVALLALHQAAAALCMAKLQPAQLAIDAHAGSARLTHGRLLEMLAHHGVKQ